MINSDFADVRTVLSAKGMAHMGIGTASGEDRCTEATQQAIKSPLLETTIDGAKGVLINVVGGPTLGMMEVDNATNLITSAVDEEARIIFAMGIDDAMGDDVRVTVIATHRHRSGKHSNNVSNVIKVDYFYAFSIASVTIVAILQLFHEITAFNCFYIGIIPLEPPYFFFDMASEILPLM